MARTFTLRLCLDALAAGLLVFCLSYWWLGDAAHEIAGTAMLLLVAGHNVFNRLWYCRMARSQPAPMSLFDMGVVALLATVMLLLLVTSAMISTVLPDWASAGGWFDGRRWHVLAAYWTFAAVSVHLGLRWPMVMGVARRTFGLSRAGSWRTGTLRLATLAVVACGLWSVSVLQLGARLTNRVSLDWWNFDEEVSGFFAHCAAAAGLLIAVGYYVSLALRTWLPPSRPAVPQHVHKQ